MLMIPDLLGFWLTGEQVAERTNASTTGLLDVTNGAWNATLIDKVGLSHSLFPSLVDPGTRIGSLRDDVAGEVGAAVDVIAVGSHDTASAVGCTDDRARRRVHIVRHLVAGRRRA